MQLSLPASTRCSSIQHRSRMHKFMGLHHYNLISTAPNHASSPEGAAGAQIRRSSSGPLMPHSSSYGSSSSMLTCAVRGGMGPNSLLTVRCLPVEDVGLLQLSGTNPGDAIMGDVDTEPRPGMGKEQQGQQGRSQAGGESSIAHALKANIPQGPLAEDAAMCEPMPGDPPGNITDEDLAAMRGGRPGINANISTGGSAPASSSGGEGMQTAGGFAAAAAAGGIEAGGGGSNAPSSDPEHIKQVVQEETLHGQE